MDALNPTNNFTYQYDASGNMTNAMGGGQSWRLTYDEDNRTTSLMWATNGVSKFVTNRYDALGRRIARKVDGVETRYVLGLFGGMERILCDTTASGQITAWYIHGPDLCYRVDATSNVLCYHADAQANIISVTDGGGTNVAQYAYTPYGRSLGSSVISNLQSQISNPYTFVGSQGVMEELPGLYFMRARYYSADAGVFLSTDPVKKIGPGWKPDAYGYAGENPLRYNDPDGRFLHIAAGAFIGGVVGFTLENARQWGEFLGGGEGFNLEKLIQKTVGGGVAGGIGAATFGGSFIVGGAAGELTETAIEDLSGEARSAEDYVTAARNGAIWGSISHFLGGLVSIGKSGQLYPGNVPGPAASTFTGGVSGSHGVNEAVKSLIIDGAMSIHEQTSGGGGATSGMANKTPAAANNATVANASQLQPSASASSSSSTKPAGSTAKPPSTGSGSTSSSSSIRIPSGATLSGLAQAYGTTVSALLRLNQNISNPNLIYAGAQLRIR